LDFGTLEIAFFRHGETVFNRDGLVSGSSNARLTTRGRNEAKQLGTTLSTGFDVSFCSGLSRSCATLDLVLNSSNQRRLTRFTDPRIRERSLGRLEGFPAVHVPEFACGDIDYAPEDGESYRLLAQRCLSFLIDLRIAATKSHWQSVLLSTHMGPMRVLHSLFSGIDDPQVMMGFVFPNSKLLRATPKTVAWPPYLG